LSSRDTRRACTHTTHNLVRPGASLHFGDDGLQSPPRLPRGSTLRRACTARPRPQPPPPPPRHPPGAGAADPVLRDQLVRLPPADVDASMEPDSLDHLPAVVAGLLRHAAVAALGTGVSGLERGKSLGKWCSTPIESADIRRLCDAPTASQITVQLHDELRRFPPIALPQLPRDCSRPRASGPRTGCAMARLRRRAARAAG